MTVEIRGEGGDDGRERDLTMVGEGEKQLGDGQCAIGPDLRAVRQVSK